MFNFKKGGIFIIKKNELLSIGEMAKLTGTGIRALHYYERKNILKPAYTDPSSGYRYYTLEQVQCVEVISVCVELDIPLKEVAHLFDAEDSARLWEFFAKNKEVAEKKLQTINLGLSLMNKVLKKIKFNKQFKIEQIYEREIPKKVYYVKPCGQSLKDIRQIEQIIELTKEGESKLNFDGADEPMVLMEHGVLCKYTPEGKQYYVFIEILNCMAGENTISIEAGTYFFRQDKKSKIENAPQMFEQQIGGRESYMIIEVKELLSGKTKINESIHELRLIL